MISITTSESTLQNFKSVIEYARNKYKDTNIHTEMLESMNLDSYLLAEEFVSGENDLINEATDVTDAKIIHDGKGTAISVKVNGKEYRYVSANKSTSELYRSFMGMLKYANAGYKALNWLKKNSFEYYGSKNPSEEGKKLLGLSESIDYTLRTQDFYDKAKKYDIGDITKEDVYNKTPKFNKLVGNISKSLGAGGSCFRYAAIVASIMSKLNISYKLYQGSADPNDGRFRPFTKEELDSNNVINHVWIVCNNEYYESFGNSKVIHGYNPKIIELKESIYSDNEKLEATQPGDIPPKDTDEEINESVSQEVINTSKSGMSYYDDFLNTKDHDYKRLAKGLQGEIVYMAPQEYIKRLGTDIFHCSYERVMRGVDQNNVDQIASKMASGTKYNLPILDLANKTQEGRHRALAAESLGLKKIPVLVVNKWDAHKELGMPKCMDLWYGHTIQWTKKNGSRAEVHVGLDLEKVRDKVQEIVKSGDYQK